MISDVSPRHYIDGRGSYVIITNDAYCISPYLDHLDHSPNKPQTWHFIAQETSSMEL